MPNTTLTVSDIRTYVETRLGKSQVCVELDPADLDQCIADAIRQLTRNRPYTGNAKLTVVKGQNVKRIDDLHPGFLGVISCDHVDPRRLHTSDVDPFEYGWRQFGASGGLSPTDYAQQQQYREQSRDIMSSEFEWHGTWEQDGTGAEIFRMYVDAPWTPMLVSYKYTRKYTPDSNAFTGMQTIPEEDVDFVQNYATARAKQILGRARGKYHGILGPTGDMSEVDWSELLEEGRTEEEAQIIELRSRRRPLPPVLG